MDNRKNEIKSPGIVYSCYHQLSRDGEHFVPEHTLTYQVAGDLVLNDGNKTYRSSASSFRLIRRNQLIKFVKSPPENGEYKSLSIYLSQKTLQDFGSDYGYSALKRTNKQPVIEIKSDSALQSYVQSLLSYHESGKLNSEQLLDLKIREVLLLLLGVNPELKNVLFDFTEPHKINLEAFMNKNYHFNVSLDRFAYLTGRSLATFKRDFEKIFGDSPGRWLQQKRLQEAHFLIVKKGQKASHVYLDLGFENLSHFSYAYKKMYGVAPSKA